MEHIHGNLWHNYSITVNQVKQTAYTRFLHFLLIFDYFPIGYVEVIIWKVCGLHHDLFNRYGFSVSDHGYVPPVVRTYRACSHAPPITRFVTRIKRRMPLVEQEPPSLPEILCSPLGFSGLRVPRSLVFCVVFCRSLFVIFLWSLCCLSFDLRILITSFVSSNSSFRFVCYMLKLYFSGAFTT